MVSETTNTPDGPVAIVTGAAGRIGVETVRALAEEHMRVVLADLPGSGLDEICQRLSSAGHSVASHDVDITDEASVTALVEFTMATFGRIDVLDNNAGATTVAAAEDRSVVAMSTDVWDRIYAINARGTMLMCKHTLPVMREQGSGSVINITSGTAKAGDFAFTAYASSKAAVEALTRYIATQHGGDGIRCNAIAPGLVRVPDVADDRLPGPMQTAIERNTLASRIGVPRDIADAVAFLASSRSAYLTGHVLPIDGGFFAHLPTSESTRELLGYA